MSLDFSQQIQQFDSLIAQANKIIIQNEQTINFIHHLSNSQHTFTHIIKGNSLTYNLRHLLKTHFDAKWNPHSKEWFICSNLSLLQLQQQLSLLILKELHFTTLDEEQNKL